MTTVLRVSPRRFVSTPSVERIIVRALRYLQSGYSIHLRGPAGTGKTTLALHLADLVARPLMLVYGDDEFKTSDLIGGQTGYTRKKVVDNYIHSVVKVEDEFRQNWTDSRLTLACREGFTLVYDEFNRSRPEVNNVLLSALEEKLLVLPPSNNRSEYLRVSPDFRAILTSNPEEYCGVHDTQDALMDRLITINIPEPDELTQQEILVQKAECDRASAVIVTRLVRTFRRKTQSEKISGLRSCLMIAKIAQEHGIPVAPENVDFRDICSDILLSRASTSLEAATKALWEVLNDLIQEGVGAVPELTENVSEADCLNGVGVVTAAVSVADTIAQDLAVLASEVDTSEKLPPHTDDAIALAQSESLGTLAEPEPQTTASSEQAILDYLQRSKGSKLSEIERALRLDRFQTVDTLRLLMEGSKIVLRNRLYVLMENAS
ncbi:gas vesicle protein GvpN [Phormidium sp. CLA17]|uniref:gas vesicle protein GvpN n=1 Tax=Leptolyngbya sp. Cla-17 TaxID=2803751 RepID=UPI001490D95D|nr:gas vesicle protein GvpN [Leptolyngbya sp. Cla-17]MBM0740530.1 gas vesicle protein GvpN [Leptolyngbya sp. Cla-17]